MMSAMSDDVMYAPRVVDHAAVFDDDHMTVWLAEKDSDSDLDWYQWIDEVELRLGNDPDGNIDDDGYSMDSFHQMWARHLTVDEAVQASPADHRRFLDF